MSLDASLISLALRREQHLFELQQAGITSEMFAEDWGKVWRYVCRMRRDHKTLPSPDMVRQRFSWVEFGPVRRKDMPILLADIKKRHAHTLFIEALTEAAEKAGDYESVDDAMQVLQSRINSISTRNGAASLRDLFSSEVSESVLSEIRLRRSGRSFGLPTGFNKLDAVIGGMQRKRMIVLMGRTGLGKSWLDLLFVANAVMNGGKFIVYPLEMTLYETAFRLYTIFTQAIYGADRVLKNFDLSSGHVTPKKLARFLNALEDKFSGQLYVADMGSIEDRYTPERVEAECEIHRPDGYWVDYITLMKPPNDSQRERDDVRIRMLVEALKGVAQRQDVIGGCSAQVSRDAIKSNIFLPGLEHISFGDAIGATADQVISINRRGKYLYYGLVKNRHGASFGKTRVQFFPNEGLIREDPDDEDNE